MITYFGIFDTLKQPHRVKVSPACCKKMEYVAEAVQEVGEECRVVSIAEPDGDHFKVKSQMCYQSGAGTPVVLLSSVCGKGLLPMLMRLIGGKLTLLFYFLKNIKRHDIILLYHTPRHIEIFYLMKIVLGLKMILEVEEIYDKVSRLTPYHRWMEYKIFKIADAYIFPTEMLNEQVNDGNKPYVIIYGNYKSESTVSRKHDDGRIHIVYSGTFNERKGGAKAAIASTEYLDDHYCMHIAGWGTDDEVNKTKQLVDKTAIKTACKLVFDGYVGEKEYSAYLQKCHIGLNTQNPNDILSTACFPSKILVYMSNGLAVVSSESDAIEKSVLAPHMVIYKEQTGKSIAEAIKRLNINTNNRQVVERLHQDAVINLANLISNA